MAIGGTIAYIASRRRPYLIAAIAGPATIFGLTIILNYTLPSSCTDAQREAGEDCESF